MFQTEALIYKIYTNTLCSYPTNLTTCRPLFVFFVSTANLLKTLQLGLLFLVFRSRCRTDFKVLLFHDPDWVCTFTVALRLWKSLPAPCLKGHLYSLAMTLCSQFVCSTSVCSAVPCSYTAECCGCYSSSIVAIVLERDVQQSHVGVIFGCWFKPDSFLLSPRATLAHF